MSKIFGCLFAILAIGCSATEAPTSLCPTFPASASVKVTAHQGPDFWDCEVSSNTSEPLFNVYIGNHPDVPRNLTYGGTVESDHRDMVWFSGSGGKASGQGTWRTFIPTGDASMSVVMASFTSTGPEDFRRRAELVAQLRLVK